MTKNVFAVFHFRPVLLLAASAWMVAMCLGPVVFLGMPDTRLPALLTLAWVAGMYVLSSRSSRISPWYAMLFPVGAAVTVYAMLRSMLVTVLDGGVTWRGTFYPLVQLRAQDRAAHGR
jgi:hypothetical protein